MLSTVVLGGLVETQMLFHGGTKQSNAKGLYIMFQERIHAEWFLAMVQRCVKVSVRKLNQHSNAGVTKSAHNELIHVQAEIVLGSVGVEGTNLKVKEARWNI